MTHVCQEDGITYLDGGEQYHVTGWVTVRVRVDFTTTLEPHDNGFDGELEDAVAGSDCWEIEDDGLEGLDFTPEEIE